MESLLEGPLKDWRIGSAFDEHHPHYKLRHHAVPGGACEQWRPIHWLGEGAFGEVYKEKCERGFLPGRMRAVKRISKEQAGFLKSSQRELQALATFSKKNDPRYQQHFVQFLGWFEDPSNLYIAMEFMPHGNLQQYIDDKAPFPETEGSLLVKQVAMGLRYMHQKGFLHRDLKPLNILVDTPGPEWKVKLADFGIARNIAGPMLYTHYIGTYGYIAPELFESSDAYTAAVDIWALGAIVFCMCTGAPPFEQPQHLLQYRAGMRYFPSQVLGLSTGFCIDFILGTMHADPRQRLEMDEIMDHEWLSMERTVMNMSNPFTKHMSLRSFDPWDLKQAAVALDNPVSGKILETIDPTLTCLGCESSFSERRYLFYHLAKNPSHYRDLMPGERPIDDDDFSDPFGIGAFFDRRQERFKRSCMFCNDEFDSRDALFEHLEESGHAVDRGTCRHAPGYKRPEVCKKRDRSEHPHRKARKVIAKLEKERAEYRLVLQEQRRQQELKRKEELQKKQEEEEEQLQKLKREEKLRREQEEVMKQQEKQKRQRELDKAEKEAQQRQAKRIKMNAGFVCRVCAGRFDTRNQLFSHIKKAKHRVPWV